MIVDCREDPCGECRHCRLSRPAREAELPDVDVDPYLVAAINEPTEGSER